MLPFDGEISYDHFIWVLGSLCQLHRLPFDPQLLGQQFPPPYSLALLLSVADALGFIAEVRLAPVSDLSAHELPCVAFLSAPVETAGPIQSEARMPCLPVLIVRKDAERLIYFRAGTDTPVSLEPAEVAPSFLAVTLVFRRKDEPADSDEADKEPKKFGFRWFVPELLKYKAIWREVLLASLAIQMVGLAMPLFTQVIIDKVVVHHSTSTLVVIAVALVMFTVFNGLMNWVRQYLVLHTGNRIDAVLGSRVFAHLFDLPLR